MSDSLTQTTAMWLRRRTRFQLTPLMDLLLIIVFAQFLEVRQTSLSQARQLQQERSSLTVATKQQQRELADMRQALNDQRQEFERQQDQFRSERDAALASRELTSADAEQAVRLLKDWLQLDPDEAASFIERANTQSSDDAESVNPITAAVRQSERLAKADGDTLIRFLIGHNELLKRAEVWNVHAGQNGEIRLEASGREQAFRLEAVGQSARTREVADQLFAAYKQLPEPKGLVILLVSFDPQSVAGVYQPLVDAIPDTLERLRADTPSSRFEYTVLGPIAAPATPTPEASTTEASTTETPTTETPPPSGPP